VQTKIGVSNISVGLGRVLNWPDNYFTLANSLSFTVYDLRNAPNYIPGCVNCTSNSITLNTTLARNSIDNPMYPSQGSTISLSGTFTPPFSSWRDINYETATSEEIYKWVEYYKIMFDAKYYIPLDRKNKLVFEAKAHFGFIGRYTTKLDYTPFERFFLGGAGLAGGFGSFVLGQDVIGLRGYDDNQITPPYTALDNSVRGGIVYTKLGMELRYPITTSNAATIYGFLFAEAGNNWNNYQQFNPYTLYKAAGFGVRIFMPAFGLIGLNWGLPFDPFPLGSDNPVSGSKFQFTIGQQIR
jgi:outer membrane protein insertion porin family